jgi:hypothetical protein
MVFMQLKKETEAGDKKTGMGCRVEGNEMKRDLSDHTGHMGQVVWKGKVRSVGLYPYRNGQPFMHF